MIHFAALCAVGAEKILANELKQLGYAVTGNATGRVMYTGDEDALYRSNLCLRTADRVYLSMAVFPASDFDALFEGVKALPWEDYFPKNIRVIVDKVRSFRSSLSSEHSIQSVTHKAIYSRLSSAWRITSLPETGETAAIRVYIEKDIAHILLDLSGMPLHRRGYRTTGGEAPIRETLAAILLQLMFWKRKTPLHDPFCGSGTIPVEAALYAYNIAPGLGRGFGIEHLAIYDKRKDAEIRAKAASEIRADCLARITGSDIDEEAIVRAKANTERALVLAGRALQSIGSDAKLPRPDFISADFAELQAPYEKGMIISNPPYGERLGTEAEAVELYRKMGSLVSAFPGWEMGFITSNTEFENAFGQRAEKKKELKSGNLDTCFYRYSTNGGGSDGHHS
ncbi:MAG: class I SAM-dependent RNA methyltransferase [Spirochaetaceae bacterium]|jgi:putative N6-adenine-specific DNA methylase|nr:class I SAM-dependent RNA methyltransferase [Spirochaetaceae bacterium]